MTILKADVATGVHWVEVPEADVRILCGCPADSVKHLMKRGLIRPVERDGARFETGPNAILLSDTVLQNGAFSNLAEFPVLQMLYRQGMLLPDHPNNTGHRPILIGAEDQIRAQLEYIFRGNYGLVSQDELLRVGVDEDTAKRWMRIKLRFAFGTIRSSRELLDTRVIEDLPVEVANGVTVQRLGINRFEVAFETERVEVDLGLRPTEEYETPYRLGYHNLRREYFAVVHTGDGDGWDVNRPSMGSILMFQGRIYLIDAGPNIDESLRSLGIGIQEVEGIFHTHGHDDHFAGLTALVRADHRIKYFAAPSVRASVAKKLAALMSISEESFEDFFDIHDLETGAWNDVNGLEVKPAYSPHPVETTIFYFRAMGDRGYRTYAHLADIVSMSVLDGMVTQDPDAPGLSAEDLEAVRDDYLAKADVKKLDVGGGLIHGSAADFVEDTSGKLILAHRATPITRAEKEIGSGAPFGTTDILIPSMQDYAYRSAAAFLRSYFPKAQPHQMDMLLNHEIQLFNPETFLAKEGETCTFAVLVLSGQVEVFQAGAGLLGLAAAGAMLGEIAAIGDLNYRKTYRTRSFVKALRIPAETFRRFIRESGLAQEIAQAANVQAYLEKTSPFGENMSHHVLRQIAGTVEAQALAAGDAVNWGEGDRLCVVREGSLDIVIGGHVSEQVGPMGTCGETCVLFGVPPVYSAVAREQTKLMLIPTDRVTEIPVTRWKLLEMYQRRMQMLVQTSMRNKETSPWWTEFEIGIPDMDAQHRELFDLAKEFAGGIEANEDRAALAAKMDNLINYTFYHFREEEKLLARHGYSGHDQHMDIHSRQICEIEALARRIESGEHIGPEEFRSFFLSWIVFHILVEDRKYARVLTGKLDYAI